MCGDTIWGIDSELPKLCPPPQFAWTLPGDVNRDIDYSHTAQPELLKLRNVRGPAYDAFNCWTDGGVKVMENGVSGAIIQAPHGVKRRADDEPKDDQRLAKRFNLLNLEHNGKLYVPVSNQSGASVDQDGRMHLDDTRDKVYIHNLDDEIKDIETEERLTFLPDIEKRIGKIPQHLLRPPDLQPTAENQIVVYGIPPSLSVSAEHDNVRKAILESRARAREKQLQDARPQSTRNEVLQTPSGQLKAHDEDDSPNHEASANQGGEDAMDIG